MKSAHTMEHKGKLLYMKFYIDLDRLGDIFVNIGEGWRKYLANDARNTHSYESIDRKYMASQAHQMFFKNENGTLESISYYLSYILDQHESFRGSNKIITIVPTNYINPNRSLVFSHLPNISLLYGLSDGAENYHNDGIMDVFIAANKESPVAEPIDFYFGQYRDIDDDSMRVGMRVRKGMSLFSEIENRIYYGLYLWCANVTPEDIEW